MMSPICYVPVLEVDDGSLITEGVAIVQYLADLKPEAGLAPLTGTRDRYRLQSWLTFISSELHKMYSPWLFHPEYGAQAQDAARAKIVQRLRYVEEHLAANGPFLMGDALLSRMLTYSRSSAGPPSPTSTSARSRPSAPSWNASARGRVFRRQCPQNARSRPLERPDRVS